MLKPTLLTALLVSSMVVASAQTSVQPPAAQRVTELANRFIAQSLDNDPTTSELTGLPTSIHSRFVDLSPAAIQAFADAESADLRDLHAIAPDALPQASRATYASLEEQLGADLQMRVCRTELWDVNHFSGWQTTFSDVAEHQPIATAGERAQALARWSALPRYLNQDIANLRHGEQLGYSAPQSVVRRVVAQMDSFLALPPEKLPFFSPAARSAASPSPDSAFQQAFRKVVLEQIDPALKHYRDFLATEYLPKARTGVALSDLPNGAACYQAFLRQNTTLNRTPAEVYALGQRTVATYAEDVQHLGQQLFGTTDIPTILARVNSAPDNRFHSSDDLLAFSRALLSRTRAITAEKLIPELPRQPIRIEPERPFEELAGMSSHYVNNPDLAQPSTYAIQLSPWQTETRAQAEIVVVHETIPGHHLQIALARQLLPDNPLARLVGNSAYSEGWARYAERMGEEDGIYQSPYTPILRRIWPAHGMVVDPGLHAMHWSRQQAIDYLMTTGEYTPKSADDLVDRIAVMPGQLTSYDSGGLTIFALRDEARQKLGSAFDLKAFNFTLLNEGIVPLHELERHVHQWLATQQTAVTRH